MIEPFVSIPAHFRERGAAHPLRPAFAFKSGDKWITRNWKEYVGLVESFGKALLAQGIGKGDVVAILAGNRPEWVIADMGSMSIGAVSTGIYYTCSTEQIRTLLEDSGARVVVVDTPLLLGRLLKALTADTSVELIIAMERAETDDSRVVHWQQFLERSLEVADDDFDSAHQAIGPDDLCSLVYTSGTTSSAKGVRLTHGNLVEITRMGLQMIGHPSKDYRLLSYLPLAHVAERGLTLLGAAMQGYTVYFAESIEKLPANLLEVQPSFFLGMPRLWEKMYDIVSGRLESLSGTKGKVTRWARRQIFDSTLLRMSGRQPGFLLRKKLAVAVALVQKPVLRQLGLDKVTTAISGSAPLPTHVQEFFASLGVVIQDVYGLSETGGPASFCRESDMKFGTIGKPFDGVEMKLGPDGEILVRGRNVFVGYHRDEQATRNALVGGWLHTGDLGEVDSDGFFRIVGRKKEILVTSYGKNIAPGKIESALKMSSLIDEAVLVGEQRRFVSALIVVNRGAAARAVGLAPAEIDMQGADLRLVIQHEIDRVNETLASAEQVRRFTILERSLTIADGEYTPTMKIVRHAVSRSFATEIERMYGNSFSTNA